ncbi:MAG: amidohydrolase, partial [Actinomycetota bacterium]|nr:amidohydrolase [Actinomycetota bacterium]
MTTTVLRGGDLVDQPDVDVVVADGWIREVVPTRPREDYGTAELVDATGMLVIPGLINNHTHGTAFGPLFPSGHEGLSHEQVLANLDRHLLEGTTTVLCVDGFVTADALARTNDAHPVTVKLASCNTPACLAAATIADGGGLADENREFTAQRAVRAGAVALGEIGAGHTLGGGGAS